MGLPEFRGIAILLSLLGFAGIFWWAFTKRNTKRFDEASKLPFTEDESLEPNATDLNSTADKDAEK